MTVSTATTTTGMNLILKPGRLRDTHSEGKVSFLPYYRIASSIRFDPKQTANWLRSQAA